MLCLVGRRTGLRSRIKGERRNTVRDANASAFFSFLLFFISPFKTCLCPRKFVSLHSKSECGEIWLLATTIKNAKREGRLRTAPRYRSLKTGRTCVCSAFCFRVIRRDGQIFFALISLSYRHYNCYRCYKNFHTLSNL